VIAGMRRIRPWQAALLGGLTLLVFFAVDLGLQEIYHRYLRPPAKPATSPVPTALPTRVPTRPQLTELPTPSPSATVPATQTLTPTPLSFPDQQVQEALQRIAFRELLLKASIELLRAEDYLASGDLKQVERELRAVSATLEQAAGYADESLLGPIGDLQRDLSRLREDLYLRPERLREGMLRLWQRVDVLIGE